MKNGWWKSEKVNIPEKLALIHSEISEALEEFRVVQDHLLSQIRFNKESDPPGQPEGFGVELADAIIRIADLAEYLGIELDWALNVKMAYNETRPYRHGGKKV